MKRNFERALDVFRALGSVEEIELPDLPFAAVAQTIISVECAAAFEEMVASNEVEKLTAPEDRVGGFADQAILATEYLRAQRIRGKLCRALDAWFAPYDAVITVPTSGTATPSDGPFGGRFSSKSLGGPGNVCGTPAICLPSGKDEAGLPTAIQLDGRAYSENRLLAIALAYQNVTSWHEPHPDV